MSTWRKPIAPEKQRRELIRAIGDFTEELDGLIKHLRTSSPAVRGLVAAGTLEKLEAVVEELRKEERGQ